MPHNNPEITEADIARGYDQHDASPRAILIFVILFLASIIGVHAAAWCVLNYLQDEQNDTNALIHAEHPLHNIMTSNPPSPRLEPEPSHNVLPREDLLTVQEREHSLLNDHSWIDAKHQFAKIPLSDATDLAVEHGLPMTLPPIGATTQQSTPLATSTHGPGGVP